MCGPPARLSVLLSHESQQFPESGGLPLQRWHTAPLCRIPPPPTSLALHPKSPSVPCLELDAEPCARITKAHPQSRDSQSLADSKTIFFQQFFIKSSFCMGFIFRKVRFFVTMFAEPLISIYPCFKFDPRNFDLVG